MPSSDAMGGDLCQLAEVVPTAAPLSRLRSHFLLLPMGTGLNPGFGIGIPRPSLDSKPGD